MKPTRTDTSRRSSYLKLIADQAKRGALSGKPGAWLEIVAAAEAAIASESAQEAGAECDPGHHAAFLELGVWGEILRACVLEKHHEAITTRLHDFARIEMKELYEEENYLLSVVAPWSAPVPGTECDPPKAGHSFEELIVVRRIQEAAKSGRFGVLRSALRSALELPMVTAGDPHRPCERYTVAYTRWVTALALAETVPSACRTVLADLAQQAYYHLYAPDEDGPEFLCEAPAPLHRPLWSSVVNGCTKVVEPDATGSRYLIPQLEARAYRWVEEDAERTRAALERLKEMRSR